MKCPKCQEPVKIPSERLGKKPQGLIVDTPKLTESPAKGNEPNLTKKQRLEWVIQEIKNGFGEKIAQSRPSFVYRLSSVVVGFVMLLLPLLYVSVIGLVGFLVYIHCIYSVAMFEGVRGRGVIILVLVYSTPIVAGVTMIFFMIKPLFAGRGRIHRRRRITYASDPLIFCLVEQISIALNAPSPKEIYVNSIPNASASFRRGLWSVFLPSDMELEIGLPLIGSLTQEQLAGVIAHELGHFSQGVGMRLSYLIRSINLWFARIVYERDSWDETLDDLITQVDVRIALVLLLAKLSVWVSRGVLWVLMYIGHFASCALMRSMEFDADRYEVMLAGTRNFERTTQKLAELNVAYSIVMHNAFQGAMAGKALRNIPALIESTAQKIPPDIKAKLERNFFDEKTGLFDTHPSNRDRVKRAVQLNAKPIYTATRPARELLTDFTKTSEQVTDDFYQNAFKMKRRSEPKKKDWMTE